MFYKNKLYEIVVNWENNYYKSTQPKASKDTSSIIYKIFTSKEQQKKDKEQEKSNELEETSSFINHKRNKKLICKSVTLPKLKKLWGNNTPAHSWNSFGNNYIWIGKKVKADLNESCTELTLTNIETYNTIKSDNESATLKKIENDF